MKPDCVDDTELEKLAMELKPSRGPAPKPEMVKAALALARDPSLVPTAVAPKGGHDRAKKLSQRILDLGVLPALPPAAAPIAAAPDGENKAPQDSVVDATTEHKLKRAEAQGRYMAKQRARQEREAYSRDWIELTEAEQAAASCFGFTNSKMWEERLVSGWIRVRIAATLRATRSTCRMISGSCHGPT
jgi:hypothetical protein